ncbi:MAG: galactonate dehydratase [Spirochaetaceae bacterium]|nr:galactonate dehydratase [Spirochaetaceae bacterium]
MRTLKITGTRTFPLDDGSLLLEMTTDAGITGYGQPLSYGHRRLVMAAVEELTGYLVGRDPFRIEDHWQVLYRTSYARAMPILVGALSGLEMAMWDIAGKALAEPVWRLLGGPVRDRVRVYAGCREPGQARELVDQGFTALKMVTERKPWRFLEPPAGMEPTVRAVAAVREEVGDGVDIAIDLHRRLSPAMSRVLLRELEPYRLLFAEEPCHWENVEALVGVARATPVPIAVGERQITRWGFREVVEREAAAVLQPDIRACGGILEMRKIAALAESHYLALAPHSGANGGPVGIAASLHVCAAIPNFLVMEGGLQRGEGLFREPLRLVDGFLELPTGPGLGFEIDTDAVAARTVDPEPLDRPMHRLAEDDSYADL